MALKESKGASFAKQGAAPTADIYLRSKAPFKITVDFKSVGRGEYSGPKYVSMCLAVYFTGAPRNHSFCCLQNWYAMCVST